MLLLGTFAPQPPVRALLTGGELRLMDEGGGVVRRVRTDARELRWSPDGSTLLLRNAKRRLFRFEPAGRFGLVKVADEAASFGWSADNLVLVGLAGRGTLVLGADGKEIAANFLRAESVAPRPDGARVAYVVPDDGVWTADDNGVAARRIAPSREAHAPSWTYDGRLIAWTDGDRLRLTRREGGAGNGDSLDLGPVADPRTVWSPGAALLLARRADGWAVWSANARAWTPLGTRSLEPPVWTGPTSLLAVEDERLLTIRIGEAPRPVELGRVRVVAAADRPTAFRGEAFADPFARAPGPRRGETQWRGRSVAFDPKTGRAEFAVESELSPTGTALVLGRPETRRATVTDRTLAKRLPVGADAELALTVRAGKVVGVYAPPLLAPPMVAPPVAPAVTPPVVTPPVAPPGVTAPIVPPVTAPRTRTGPAVDPVTGRTLRPLRAIEPDGITREVVTVPLVYPMTGDRRFTDTFLDARDGGKRRHHGNDLMAPKMTPLLAVFDGTVTFRRSTAPGASNSLTLTSDDGWSASYLHVNNDTPGTDDGLGSARYAFPADLRSGDRVRAGEVVAWCGDSGNAEDAGAHLHFELFDRDGEAIVDPFASLTAARRLDAPLYVDPDPSLAPRKEETRWEGVVVGIQPAKRAITIELTGIGEAGGPPARNLAPRLVYLELPEGLVLEARGVEGGGEGGSVPFESARAGQRLGAVGAIDGAKMRVRRATIERS